MKFAFRAETEISRTSNLVHLLNPPTVAAAPFSERKKMGMLLFFLAILVIVAIVGMTFGAYEISPTDIWEVVRSHLVPFVTTVVPSKLHDTIIWNIRLPRLLLSITVGAALATAGAVFQGCFRNPLVEPYILGVSSGAACGAALGLLFPSFFFSMQALAFTGGALAVSWTYAIAVECPVHGSQSGNRQTLLHGSGHADDGCIGIIRWNHRLGGLDGTPCGKNDHRAGSPFCDSPIRKSC
jgi:ABC-type enterobactin transport system permease subunit